MLEQSVRSLAYLQDSASTARVLNLLRVNRRHAREDEYQQAPMFRHPALNKSLIIKHRLRPHEHDLFGSRRSTATKLVIPIDENDLTVGGRSVFVGQRQYDDIMRAEIGQPWLDDPADREMLEILDQLPTLDPFLLREHLKRFGRSPARCHFEISDADVERMFRFVEHDVRELIDLCIGDAGAQLASSQAARLVRLILWNAGGPESEPLRLTMRLEPKEYAEGVFCWKGFLYYKWSLAEHLPVVQEVATAIAEAKPKGQIDLETKAYLDKEKPGLRRAILSVCDQARRTLRVYDQAYGAFVSGRPAALREFLLASPRLFTDIGERLGAVGHITNFWTSRFPKGRPPNISPEELTNIVSDFGGSLSFPELKQAA